MKHRHILTVNKVNEESFKYIYNYGRTKNIQLLISKDGISISADLQKEYDKEKMLSANGYLFSDGLKKALLLYLIIYSKNLKIEGVSIEIDGNIDRINYSDEIKLPIYSMITNELSKTIPCEFMNESLIQYILNTKKNKI